jgi:TetR/AcrR family transcriptional regulator, cholesterol catabolism regulator
MPSPPRPAASIRITVIDAASLEPTPEEPRTRRIVEVALRLAEEGGFAAVRLRDVADQAGVALRTLYKRFPSKDELLFAVLEDELGRVEQRLRLHPPRGHTAVARLHDLFERLTEVLCGRPNLGRAVVRAMAGGSPQVAAKLGGFHGRVDALIVGAIRGRPDVSPTTQCPAPYLRLSALLQHVWFSSVVAWSSGVRSTEEIVEAVTDAAALVLEPLAFE